VTEETDFAQSIDELEGSGWGTVETAETPLIQECLALRKKPLRELTNEELNLAVGQRIGFPFVLDLAFDRLAPDPLLDCGCFPGDILANLVRAPAEVWKERPALCEKLSEYYDFVMRQPPDLTADFREILNLPASGNVRN
jgi:hypothetical protein